MTDLRCTTSTSLGLYRTSGVKNAAESANSCPNLDRNSQSRRNIIEVVMRVQDILARLCKIVHVLGALGENLAKILIYGFSKIQGFLSGIQRIFITGSCIERYIPKVRVFY